MPTLEQTAIDRLAEQLERARERFNEQLESSLMPNNRASNIANEYLQHVAEARRNSPREGQTTYTDNRRQIWQFQSGRWRRVDPDMGLSPDVPPVTAVEPPSLVPFPSEPGLITDEISPDAPEANLTPTGFDKETLAALSTVAKLCDKEDSTRLAFNLITPLLDKAEEATWRIDALIKDKVYLTNMRRKAEKQLLDMKAKADSLTKDLVRARSSKSIIVNGKTLPVADIAVGKLAVEAGYGSLSRNDERHSKIATFINKWLQDNLVDAVTESTPAETELTNTTPATPTVDFNQSRILIEHHTWAGCSTPMETCRNFLRTTDEGLAYINPNGGECAACLTNPENSSRRPFPAYRQNVALNTVCLFGNRNCGNYKREHSNRAPFYYDLPICSDCQLSADANF